MLVAEGLGNVLAPLPKSAHPSPKRPLAEIYNAQNKTLVVRAAHTFAEAHGAQWPKEVAKITDDLDVLAFNDYPAKHWIHLRPANPIESNAAQRLWAHHNVFAGVGSGPGLPIKSSSVGVGAIAGSVDQFDPVRAEPPLAKRHRLITQISCQFVPFWRAPSS